MRHKLRKYSFLVSISIVYLSSEDNKLFAFYLVSISIRVIVKWFKLAMLLLLQPSVAITFQRCKGKSQLSNDLGIRYGLSKIFLSLLARVIGQAKYSALISAITIDFAARTVQTECNRARSNC